MSIISALFKWIIAIFKKIIKFVIDIIKKYWYIIAIVALIYFAPAIGAWLASSGAPAWLSTAFTWVGANVTPLLVSGISTVGGWLSSGATAAWTAFKGASIATQAGIISGVGMLLAPEETEELIGETAELAGEIIYAGAAGLVSGSGLSPWLIAGGVGLGLWFFFGRSKDKKEEDRNDSQRTKEIL